jgi:hypothetical protein
VPGEAVEADAGSVLETGVEVSKTGMRSCICACALAGI